MKEETGKGHLIKYGDWTDYVLRAISGPVARALVRCNVSPNSITLFRAFMLIGVMWLFMAPKVMTLCLAGILLQLYDVLDYVDGDTARFSGKTSKLGEWLEYVENNFQGNTGALLGFSIAIGLFLKTQDYTVWILLFFLCFGVHMKKALIVTPVKSSAWAFNIMDQASLTNFNSAVNRNVLFKIGRLFLWFSTRDLNVVALVSFLAPLYMKAWGYHPLYYALVVIAIAHHLTWLGIAYFQFVSLRENL